VAPQRFIIKQKKKKKDEDLKEIERSILMESND
jgi:hypothetical protein